jgi:hypothetical protein
VTTVFPLHLADSGSTPCVRVDDVEEVSAALAALGLHAPRPVVVLVGGAGGLEKADLDRLWPLFRSALVPVVEQHGAVGVDGGTHSGVMGLFGEARASAAASFPLVGVAAAGTVSLPDDAMPSADGAALDPRHTHFVLVPGGEWGAEAPWIARVATELAGSAPSVTVLVNGGDIAYVDARRSLDAGRQVLAVAESGRAADQLAAAVSGDPADPRAVELAASGRVRAVPAEDPTALAELLAAALDREPG